MYTYKYVDRGSNVGNICQKDIKLIPNGTCVKEVVIYATDTLSRESGVVGPINLVWPT